MKEKDLRIKLIALFSPNILIFLIGFAAAVITNMLTNSNANLFHYISMILWFVFIIVTSIMLTYQEKISIIYRTKIKGDPLVSHETHLFRARKDNIKILNNFFIFVVIICISLICSTYLTYRGTQKSNVDNLFEQNRFKQEIIDSVKSNLYKSSIICDSLLGELNYKIQILTNCLPQK